MAISLVSNKSYAFQFNSYAEVHRYGVRRLHTRSCCQDSCEEEVIEAGCSEY